MATKEAEVRSALLRMRLTPAEKARVDAKAASQGITVSNLLRRLLNLDKAHRRPDGTEGPELGHVDPEASTGKPGPVAKAPKAPKRMPPKRKQPGSPPPPPSAEPAGEERKAPANDSVEQLATKIFNTEGMTMFRARKEAAKRLKATTE